MRARMPPSPRLSARRTMARYLTEIVRMSAQKMRERTPRTFAGVGGIGWCPVKHSRSA